MPSVDVLLRCTQRMSPPTMPTVLGPVHLVVVAVAIAQKDTAQVESKTSFVMKKVGFTVSMACSQNKFVTKHCKRTSSQKNDVVFQPPNRCKVSQASPSHLKVKPLLRLPLRQLFRLSPVPKKTRQVQLSISHRNLKTLCLPQNVLSLLLMGAVRLWPVHALGHLMLTPE